MSFLRGEKGMSKDWGHSECWIKRGESFSVEIKRWQQGEDNKWNVYAYLFPLHPWFSRIRSESLQDDVAASCSAHSYVSYHKWHFSFKGDITCKQIGCDYDHADDHGYERMTTLEEAWRVKLDAEALFDELKIAEEMTIKKEGENE